MPELDLPLEQLVGYRADLTEPPDFDEFWRRALHDSGGAGATFTRVDSGLVAVDTFDVSFGGFGGHPIRAWLHLPAAAIRTRAALPAVVQFQGYNGGRGLAHEEVFWAAAGYAHLVVDTRGQGSGWAVGDTDDPVGSPSSHPGYATRGIASAETYYYRRVFVDAVRAVAVLRSHPDVDPDRVVVAGGSQGGAIALAAGALADGVRAVMPDVPFLCDIRRGTRIAPADPYAEIARYLMAHRDRVEPVMRTLSYFDGVLMARRCTAPGLFSVALMDQTCPPSTVFAAYNAYAGPKDIVVYEYNDHEGGGPFQRTRQLSWLPRAPATASSMDGPTPVRGPR